MRMSEENEGEISLKNTVKEWNNLSGFQKTFCVVLVVVCWMIILGDWVRIGDILGMNV